MKKWIATYVETSDSCDGKARTLGIFDTKEKCQNEILLDMQTYEENHADEGVEMNYNKLSAHFYGSADGCEWNFEEIDFPCSNKDVVKQTERVLIDNGIEEDEASTVLQAIGYTLLDTELYPEDEEDEDDED